MANNRKKTIDLTQTNYLTYTDTRALTEGTCIASVTPSKDSYLHINGVRINTNGGKFKSYSIISEKLNPTYFRNFIVKQEYRLVSEESFNNTMSTIKKMKLSSDKVIDKMETNIEALMDKCRKERNAAHEKVDVIFGSMAKIIMNTQ